MRELSQRLSVSAVIITLLLAAIYFSHEPYFQPFFVLIGAMVICGALWEYYMIGKIKGFEPLIPLGMISTLLYIISTQLNCPHLPAFVLLLTLMAAFAYYFIRGKSPYANLAITLFGLAYLTIPLTTLIQINFLEQGSWWLLYLLLVTKITDSGAYFSGKQWGVHKLSAYISPGKTWEGAIGGIAAGTAASIVSCLCMPHIALSLTEALLLGVAISIIAQFGDLAESLLKRDGGIKNSNSLPGLGGLLDIVDSLIFTSPLFYLYLLEVHS